MVTWEQVFLPLPRTLGRLPWQAIPPPVCLPPSCSFSHAHRDTHTWKEGLSRFFHAKPGLGLLSWRNSLRVRQKHLSVREVARARLGHAPCTCPPCPFVLMPCQVASKTPSLLLELSSGITVGQDRARRARTTLLLGYRRPGGWCRRLWWSPSVRREEVQLAVERSLRMSLSSSRTVTLRGTFSSFSLSVCFFFVAQPSFVLWKLLTRARKAKNYVSSPPPPPTSIKAHVSCWLHHTFSQYLYAGVGQPFLPVSSSPPLILIFHNWAFQTMK